MLSSRTFAFALLTGAFGLLAMTTAVNFVLDPQYVFGTPLTRHDENANYRYHRMREYQAQRERTDGALFASSRGRAFDPDLLARKLGAASVAKFDVTAGMITDHLPALEYVLRDKAARGEKLRAALLLIDVDSFGKLPSTNVNIDSFLPPELSGEHPARFWWRYLTVFQFRMWRGIVAHRWLRGEQAELGRGAAPFQLRPPMAAGLSFSALRGMAQPVAQRVSETPTVRLMVATRPNLEAHLAQLARFVALCRDNGINLTVATSPMRADAASRYDPADLGNVVERLSRVMPIWDFSAPPRIAADAGYWDDPSHFKPTVAAMMLERMFGARAPADFGVLRGAKTASTTEKPM